MLRSGGWSVLEQAGAAEPPDAPGDVLKRLLAALPTDRDLVLVPHSNAGLYVPELTRRRRVIGYVFVDTILPPDGSPQHLVTELESLADESGILPPWTAWWGDDDLRGLSRSRYPWPHGGTSPTHPCRYLRSTISLPLNWNRYPGAYLAFGDTYAEDRAAALALGWPTATITGRHLHQLHQPDVVAERMILALARQAGLKAATSTAQRPSSGRARKPGDIDTDVAPSDPGVRACPYWTYRCCRPMSCRPRPSRLEHDHRKD